MRVVALAAVVETVKVNDCVPVLAGVTVSLPM
jgi:hypothetical protein